MSNGILTLYVGGYIFCTLSALLCLASGKRSYRLSVNVEYAVKGLVLSFSCGNRSYFLSFLVCELSPSDVGRTVADSGI